MSTQVFYRCPYHQRSATIPHISFTAKVGLAWHFACNAAWRKNQHALKVTCHEEGYFGIIVVNWARALAAATVLCTIICLALFSDRKIFYSFNIHAFHTLFATVDSLEAIFTHTSITQLGINTRRIVETRSGCTSWYWIMKLNKRIQLRKMNDMVLLCYQYKHRI